MLFPSPRSSTTAAITRRIAARSDVSAASASPETSASRSAATRSAARFSSRSSSSDASSVAPFSFSFPSPLAFAVFFASAASVSSVSSTSSASRALARDSAKRAAIFSSHRRTVSTPARTSVKSRAPRSPEPLLSDARSTSSSLVIFSVCPRRRAAARRVHCASTSMSSANDDAARDASETRNARSPSEGVASGESASADGPIFFASAFAGRSLRFVSSRVVSSTSSRASFESTSGSSDVRANRLSSSSFCSRSAATPRSTDSRRDAPTSPTTSTSFATVFASRTRPLSAATPPVSLSPREPPPVAAA